MRIIRISIWHVPLTSHENYYMAAGKSCVTVESVIVRLDTDAGISGWGEVCPIPHYLPAYAGGVAPAIQEMAPVILGADAIGPEAFMARVDAHLIGHGYAKSPIDMAVWDINAKAAGVPLCQLLGGQFTDRLPLYHSITCVAPDEMRRMAKEAKDAGMTQFQAKLGADDDWLADVERLKTVREVVGDGPIVYGDWNCGSTKQVAIRVGRAVNDLDIMLEQPCETLEECASVKRATGLPMKIDENAKSPADIIRGNELDCMDVVALKISKFGGLSAARRARDLCVHFGTRMCVEDTWGSDIVTAAALHLGASTQQQYVMNVCDLSSYVGPRIAPDGPLRNDGRIAVPTGPGLGVTPDLDLLGESDVILD